MTREENTMKKTKSKKTITIILVLALLCASVGAYFAKRYYDKVQEEKAAEIARIEAEKRAAEAEAARQAQIEEARRIKEDRRTRNPLTGLKMNENAIGKRPVAIMVENTPDARPQWGMDDKNYSPDIILEAEVEYGITRTMWMFADFTSLPKIIGPIRSARPPFVKFSELFDTIYVHWGQSDSAGAYVGASTIIAQDGVNNINQLEYRGRVDLYGRSKERNVAIEHTGIIYSKNLPTAIDEYGYRTELNPERFTSFEFTDTPLPMSDVACNEINVTISDRSWTKHWKYSESDKLYHTDDFENNLTRENILVLVDYTEYITKPMAHFSYCNYMFAGGEGKLASQGTVKDIVWSIEDGKLVIKDVDDRTVYFNRGKTWIGWISANYGGRIDIK